MSKTKSIWKSATDLSIGALVLWQGISAKVSGWGPGTEVEITMLMSGNKKVVHSHELKVLA